MTSLTTSGVAPLDSPWVDSPFFEEMLSEAELDPATAEAVRHFAREGYAIIDPEIPARQLETAVRDLRDCYKPGNEAFYADDRRVQDGWNFSSAVKEIACAPRILRLLEVLYRRRPFPFQTLNFRIGSEQSTHSDIALFDSIPQRFMAAAWVALEDVDETSGPLHYYPGSHRLPVYNLYDLGVIASQQSHPLEQYSRYESFVARLMASTGFQRRQLHLKKGQALIWSSNLYHGGDPILDRERTRHSQVTHYYFAGCLYYTPLMSDPALGKIAAKQVYNVQYGRVVPQYYHGRLIENPGEWPPRLAGDPPIENPFEFPTRVPRTIAGLARKPIELINSVFHGKPA